MTQEGYGGGIEPFDSRLERDTTMMMWFWGLDADPTRLMLKYHPGGGDCAWYEPDLLLYNAMSREAQEWYNTGARDGQGIRDIVAVEIKPTAASFDVIQKLRRVAGYHRWPTLVVMGDPSVSPLDMHTNYDASDAYYGRKGIICKAYRPSDGMETEMRFDWDPATGRVALCMGGHGLHGMPHPLVYMGHTFAGKWQDATPEQGRLLQWLSPHHTQRNGKRVRECYEETTQIPEGSIAERVERCTRLLREKSTPPPA